jgi:ParB family chromosome partitioning protein
MSFKKMHKIIMSENINPGIKKQFSKHEDLLKAKEEFISGGKLIELSAADITGESTFQIRSERVSAEDFENLKESLKAHGQQIPVLVRKKGEKYQLIAGFNRYEALKQLRMPIQAIYKDVNDDMAFKIAEIENLQRNDLSILDIYNYIKKLEENGLTQKEIAQRLNKTDRMIRNYLSIGENKDLFRLIRNDVITTKEAIKLSRLPENELKKKIGKLEKLNESPEGRQEKKKIIGVGKDYLISKKKNKIKVSVAGTFEEKDKVIARLKEIIEKIKEA